MVCDTPFSVQGATGQEYQVPCGRCPNCKRNRVNAWVFRLREEERVSSSSYFVTLTYHTDCVPITDNGFMSLKKSDFQDFMKRLRHLTDNKLKYYAVGEYGSTRWRPHYHMILFNLPDFRLIEKAWKKGGVHVGSVTGGSMAYTLKYIDKEGRIPLHGRDDREKEFSLMSKGLGSSYLTPGKIQYHKNHLDKMYVVGEGGVKVPFPKYYRDKIFTPIEKEILIDNVLEAVEKNEEKEMKRVALLYSDGVEYDLYKRQNQIGRFEKFYKNQKDRDYEKTC